MVEPTARERAEKYTPYLLALLNAPPRDKALGVDVSGFMEKVITDAEAAVHAQYAWNPDMDAAPRDGTDIEIYSTTHGVCQAFFAAGEWSEETPDCPREYSGDTWVCCDDAFQIAVYLNPEGIPDDHEGVTHWRPITAPETTDA